MAIQILIVWNSLIYYLLFDPQVNGHSGAKYKSFKNLKEAQEFVENSGGGRPRNELIGQTRSIQQPKRSSDEITKLPSRSSSPAPVKKRHRNAVVPPDVRVTVMFDGGARGNPGVAGAGASVTILDSRSKPPIRKTIHIRHFLGLKRTNNEAEYGGIISGLSVALDQLDSFCEHRNDMEFIIQGDSKLIIKQLEGEYKVKSQKLKPLFERSTSLLKRIESDNQCTVVLQHVYRSENKLADSTLL